MPRVKIDYVVSFSSEDPEHPASNLLSREVSKKKWLCNKGETSCSVVLQLTKAVQISGVHIGVHHAALVEVLVARSETSTDQFQVLVASSVFVSPRESRTEAVERVRSFSGEQLAPDTRTHKWDRVRIVCSQPYNKHCKYGLSFVHIDETEGSGPPKLSPLQLLLDTHSSEEEDFKPGELFAKHQLKNSPDDAPNTTSTGAQIRQATSHALKNLPDSSTKITKTPINKPTARRDSFTSDHKLDRTRDNLLYTDDDQKPHAKIDTIVSKHKVEREKDKLIKHTPKHDKKESADRNTDGGRKSKDDTTDKRKNETTDKRKHESTEKRKHGSTEKRKVAPVGSNTSQRHSDHRQEPHHRKRPRHDSHNHDTGAEDSPHTILRGCVLVLSGYTNPRRAAVRQAALAMGAHVRSDWGPSATHLICAFPNTPKLRSVRQRGGDSVPVALAEWVEQCCALKRRLPWTQFATEPRHRRTPSKGELKREATTVRQNPPDSDTECDTDDEIEKHLQKQKKRRTNDDAPDVTDAVDMGDMSDGGSTAPEGPRGEGGPRLGGALPDFFDGHTFTIDAAQPDAEQLTRYVKAYGGVVVDDSDCEDEVEYVVVGSGGSVTSRGGAAGVTSRGGAAGVTSRGGTAGVTSRARHVVSAAWLASCHAAKQLLPTT